MVEVKQKLQDGGHCYYCRCVRPDQRRRIHHVLTSLYGGGIIAAIILMGGCWWVFDRLHNDAHYISTTTTTTAEKKIPIALLHENLIEQEQQQQLPAEEQISRLEMTTDVQNNRNNDHRHPNKPPAAVPVVHFLNPDHVTQQDSFSASWLQSRRDFMEMDLSAVGICEDAAFKAWNTRRHKLSMTLDYLDFSVEHLSKWWKHLEFYEHPAVYDSVTTKLQRYVRLAAADLTTATDPILKGTLATIAFQPYSAPKHYAKKRGHFNMVPAERATNLTIVSLAATIESLRRAEMGRVVVVGSDDKHELVARQAFDYLHQQLPHLTYVIDNNETTIGHLELGFVKIFPQHYKTKNLERNMPKGCLAGVREAFVIADMDPPSTRSPQEQQWMDQWLGTKHHQTHNPRHQYWRYLYLTEPDSILITRTTALSQIKARVDAGGIVAPFRLQPIPHESDVMGYPDPERILSKSQGFDTIIELDHTTTTSSTSSTRTTYDVCCDEKMGEGHRPGVNNYPPCSGNKKWFMCGFQPTKHPTVTDPAMNFDRHERLRPYQLFRLTQGTGLTTIAGNLFGRRCLPAKQQPQQQSPHDDIVIGCQPHDYDDADNDAATSKTATRAKRKKQNKNES